MSIQTQQGKMKMVYTDQSNPAMHDRKPPNQISGVTTMNAHEIYTTARAAGLAAAAAVQVAPMIVNAHANPLDSNSEITKQYFVSDGVCGFASVVIKNIKFANALKKMGLGRKNYGGGYALSVQDFNQSLTRKEAYAHAFAAVLNDNGITAYTDSRMD